MPSKLKKRLDAGYYDMRDMPYPVKPKSTFAARASGLYTKQLAKFLAAKNSYRIEAVRRSLDFKADLLEEHGLSDHPKAEAAFLIAWEERHSNGCGEVVDFFYEIAQLLKD